jgi:hypothetical protein
MSTTTEEATTGIEEMITHSTYPESTETEVEKGLGIRDGTETATRTEHHTNRDGQNTTTRAAVAISMTKRRRAVVDRIIEVEKHKGLT